MGFSRVEFETSLNELGLAIATDGKHWVHTTEGRYAPQLNLVITPDEDLSGATLLVSLPDPIPAEKRPPVYELLNLVHGQNLWNVRFHLADDSRLMGIGRLSTWGKPFNGVQLGDIVFSLLVTTDRVYPCLDAICRENLDVEAAFARFFLKKSPDNT